MTNKTWLFLISGPSGSGQDSVILGLEKSGVKFTRVITTTSRPLRPGESEGQPYHFLTDEEFIRQRDSGAFFESATYNGHWYGCRRVDLDEARAAGSPVIWKIDAQGVKTIKQLYPEAVAIFIHAPMEELRGRLIKRGENTLEQIETRMVIAEKVLSETDIYDLILENRDGQLSQAVAQLAEIINQNFQVQL